MAGKLVKPPSPPIGERRLAPVVKTKANTSAEDLVLARTVISRHDSLQKIFLEAKKQGKSSEEIADVVGSALANFWEGEDKATRAYGAALYLADEHAQLDPGMFLVSQETGEVIAILKPEDIETPAPVAREGSNKLAQPLPRIRPDIEAFITSWHFDQEREKKACEALAAKGHQTAFLKEIDDPRLLIVTKRGRRELARQYACHNTPRKLLEGLKGSSRDFLSYLGIKDFDGNDKDIDVAKMAVANVITSVQDIQAYNLGFNFSMVIRQSLSNGWVQEIARTVIHAAQKMYKDVEPVKSSELGPKHFEDACFWITPAELVRNVLECKPKASIFLVENAPLVGFKESNIGDLLIPKEFLVESHELFDKWAIKSRLSYALRLKWQNIKYVPVSDVSYDGHLVN
jgi:hypothetical protein